MVEVKWTVTLKVPDGPDVNETGTLDIQTFARQDVRLTSQKWETRELADGANNPLHFLLIRAEATNGTPVFQVGEGKDDQPSAPLNPPLLLLGLGAGRLLDSGKLSFKASAGGSATVQVMSGRNPA